MKKIIFKKMNPVVLCFCLFSLFITEPLFAEPHKILLINSNAGIGRYKAVQEEFKQTVSNSIYEIDLGSPKYINSPPDIRSYNADAVYCIGAKACSFANKYIHDTPLVFSSIINWQRLSLSTAAYGISNELHSRMPIFMFRSIFPGVKKIGILYSKQYTLQWFKDTRNQAEELGITIIGKAISHKDQTIPDLKKLLYDVNAVWLIPDPLVISDKEYLYEILSVCNKNKMPVFSYHRAFVSLGAVLSVSVDDPTIGRQAGGIVQELLSGGKLTEHVQFPAGSNITLDLKKAKLYNLEYNRDALGLVNDIIR